jgi:hypothetical protein
MRPIARTLLEVLGHLAAQVPEAKPEKRHKPVAYVHHQGTIQHTHGKRAERRSLGISARQQRRRKTVRHWTPVITEVAKSLGEQPNRFLAFSWAGRRNFVKNAHHFLASTPPMQEGREI